MQLETELSRVPQLRADAILSGSGLSECRVDTNVLNGQVAPSSRLLIFAMQCWQPQSVSGTVVTPSPRHRISCGLKSTLQKFTAPSRSGLNSADEFLNWFGVGERNFSPLR